MSVKQELQQLNNRLDKCRYKLASAKSRGDSALVSKFTDEIEALGKKIAHFKHRQGNEVNDQRKSIQGLAFNRALTKQEQADQGALKKSVRGLVIVHPITKLGKQLGIKEMTGYAPKKF
ncbi:YibL family ribosome-associated protein [Vibrio tapetis]|uniref:YibL family ribosome-associated protein n=1 Tax=Vibrio tapetis subsp. tapetis TaxID=1671868 RepID=A0A2N8ZKW6_9VIBR|nr:YibL family ribosome-associated protein [Vibrio tapetis]SON52516.1 conserved protein of unknown function [Vibrio tapetis subsp. tapetis]